MITMSTFSYTNGRNHRLHCVEYRPPAGTKPKAALFLHHGIAEHIGRYDAVFTHWAQHHALAVYGYDCHGHGRSEPHEPHGRIYVHRFDDLVDDFVDFVAHVTRERLADAAGAAPSPLPRVVGGHSLGGLIAACAVLRIAEQQAGGAPDTVANEASTGLAGLVLHSAALDVVWTPVLRALAAVGALLAMVVPRARIVPAVKPEAMHPDPEVVAEYVSDPHVVIGNTRARTANEVLRGFRSLQGKERLFALPVLAVHGSADATTSLEAVRNFVRRAGRGGGKGREGAGGGNATLREVEGGYHELMAAPGEREREAEEVARWVEALPAVVGAAAGGRGGGAGASVPSSRL